MAAAQGAPNATSISFFSASPTVWAKLDPVQKTACIGVALQSQIESHYAWNPTGLLRDRWNQVGYNTYLSVIKTGPKPQKISPPQLWLLSVSNQPEDAIPYILITCRDSKKHGNNTIYYLGQNDRLKRFGIPYLCRLSKMRTYTKTGDVQQGDVPGLSLCAARIAVYTGTPKFSTPKRNLATIGAVLKIGEKYYALTAAHVFFKNVDTGKSWNQTSLSLRVHSQPFDTTRTSEMLHNELPPPQLHGAYEIVIESLWPHDKDLEDNPDLPRNAIGRVAPQIHRRGSPAANLPEVIVNYDLDWALIELSHETLRRPNSLALASRGSLPLVLPKENDLPDTEPPAGEVLLACGISGQVSGTGLGTVGGILLPWRNNETQAWSVECKIEVGDSGSLAVDSRSGHIYGMVVAHDEDLMITYIIPLSAIFNSIRVELGDTPSEVLSVLNTIARDDDMKDSLTKISKSQPEIEARASMPSPPLAAFNDSASIYDVFRSRIKDYTIRNTFGQQCINTNALRSWMVSSARTYPNVTNLEILLDFVYRDLLTVPISSEALSRSDDPYVLTFCLFLELDHGELIQQFYWYGFGDRKLPYTMSSLRETLLVRGSELEVNHVLFERLFERQWAYCPFDFDLGTSKVLSLRTILPIVQRQRINNKGATAELWEISVPENFVSERLRRHAPSAVFNNPTDNLGKRYHFAVKTFSQEQRRLFRDEREAFQLLSGNRHFIRCFGDYTIEAEEDTTYNMLLEYGELDLNEYYAAASPPALSGQIHDFWTNFSNVVEAVRDLHAFRHARAGVNSNFLGWHHDIKPDNILLVDGKFKLSDPGFARFNKTGQHKSQIRGGTVTYGPPEVDLRGTASAHEGGQFVDIWSLGCVFSEAATWVVLGHAGLRQYSLVRENALKQYTTNLPRRLADEYDSGKLPLGNQFHNSFGVLDVVREWHEFLRITRRRSDMTTERILRITDRSMLLSDPEERVSASLLFEHLDSTLRETDPSTEGTYFSFENVLHSTSLDEERIQFAAGRENARPRAISYISAAPDPVPTRTSSPSRVTHRHALRTEVLPAAPISAATSQQYSPLKPVSQDSLMPLPAVGQPRSKPSGVLYQTVIDAKVAMDAERSKPSFIFRLQSRKRDPLLRRYFDGRTIVFLIDNAESMAQHWSEVILVMETLAKKLQGLDQDGFDVMFTSGRVSFKLTSSKGQRQLLERLNSKEIMPIRAFNANIADSLRRLLSDYLEQTARSPSKVRNRSIIVLTDGLWRGSKRPDEVEGAIFEFFKALEKIEGLRLDINRRIGIQFIQFGNDPDATARLEKLDREMEVGGVPEVIDTEPATGNIYKMLLGSFVAQYDDDERL